MDACIAVVTLAAIFSIIMTLYMLCTNRVNRTLFWLVIGVGIFSFTAYLLTIIDLIRELTS